MSQIIEEIEKKQMKEINYPDINVGYMVIVHSLISEGKKTRVQRFQGLVVKMTGARNRQSLTVRKIVNKVGVEKTFLLHSLIHLFFSLSHLILKYILSQF